MSTFFDNTNAGNLHRYSVALSTDGATTTLADWNTGEVSPAVGEHMFTTRDISIPSDHYHTHQHTNTSHTHSPGTTGNESTHSHSVVSGFSNGTSPDNMGLMVDGIDVTSQLGGPWNAAQTELDVTPFVAPGTGFHLIQITTATQVGRIYGFARLKSINNNLGPGA
jgi:hypothetical protein